MPISETLSLRPARLGDLEDIVAIAIVATADQALILFNFPHRLDFPQDNYYHWKTLIKASFYDPNSIVLLVEKENGAGRKVIAWAEWEWKGTDPAPNPPYCDSWTKAIGERLFNTQTNIIKTFWTRHDDNPTHRSIWVATKTQIDRDYWSSQPRLVYLSALYTQPEFQDQGAGTMLKNWGLALAKQHHTVLGVLASHPPSVAIYKHWGFEEVDVVRMQQEGETEHVDIHVLRHESQDN